VLILNRVAEETDAITRENQSLSRAVQTIRRCSYELTQALADGEVRFGDRMDAIWSALDDAREAASGTSPSDDREHVLRNGLVFGLGEVADSLQDLVDLSSVGEARRS
jgi:hypothetical protein